MSGTELVTIGQIIKPFGLHGDVRVRSLSDIPGRFERLGAVTLETRAGQRLETSVVRVRPDRDGYIVGFQAFSTPEQAAAFRGALIKLEPDRTETLAPGHYLECDLIGLSVRTEDGRVLGSLDEVLQTPSNAVFVVRHDGVEILIPATKEIVTEIDLSNRLMTVRLIKGLLDDDARQADAV
jgi:16S rRNA processing protein RimM